MPTMPDRGGLESIARRAPGTHSHLAETGHTLETHYAVPEREAAALDAREQARDGQALGERVEVEAGEESPEGTHAEDKVGTLPAMAVTRYLLNTTTGTLHDTQNLSERCNTDQIDQSERKRSASEERLMQDSRFRRKCRWCHPKVMENPDAEAAEAPKDDA